MTINYECVKEICKELRKAFKGMQSNSYGYCCNSDYDYHHTYINNDDYVCAKIYKGGLNNQYHNGEFEMYDEVYFSWKLTNFGLLDVIRAMQKVANNYGYKVIVPENESKCITLSV